MQNRKQLGAWGEDKAVEFLENKKYKVIHRNWKNKWGEIDIVAKNKKTKSLVFCEVKTIKKKPGFSPIDQINDKKKKQLLKMAQIYLSANKLLHNTPHQIDIIAIEKDGDNYTISHFENTIEDIY